MLNFRQYLAESSAMKGAWYNMRSKRAFDISSDVGPGTNDHLGFIWATENGANARKLGMKLAELTKLQQSYETGDWDTDAVEETELIFKRGNIRFTAYRNQLAIQSLEVTDHYLIAIQDALAKMPWLGLTKDTQVVWTDPIEVEQINTDLDSLLRGKAHRPTRGLNIVQDGLTTTWQTPPHFT